MTTKTEVQTLGAAQAERDRLAGEARRQDEIVDKLAADRLALLTERRQAWARDVLADAATVGTALATAETAAARAFRAAAVDGDARSAYFEWTDARNAVNQHRDRVGAARSFIGQAQTEDAGYPIKDTPSYSAELDRALSSEASNRWADRQAALQLEINDLDVLP